MGRIRMAWLQPVRAATRSGRADLRVADATHPYERSGPFSGRCTRGSRSACSGRINQGHARAARLVSDGSDHQVCNTFS